MRLDDGFFEQLRRRGDPLGDAAVAELCRTSGRPDDLVDALRSCAEREDGACRALLDHVHLVPRWVKFEAMEPGCSASLRLALPCGLVLLCASLVESYAGFRGAKVLIRAGGLSKNPVRRVYETAAFSFEIARSGASRPGTEAHREILRVRLIHAFVRMGMLRRNDFDLRAWGHPINQEDLAGTLLTFSHVLPRGLRTLGAQLTYVELASFQHHWRWIGHLLGIDSALLTDSVQTQQALYERIRERQLHPDEDSRVLTRTLFEALGGRAPFYLPRARLEAISRFLIGDELADALQLPPAHGTDAAVELTRGAVSTISRVFGHTGLTALAAEQAGIAIASATIQHGLRRA